jgi:phosphoadenosine phosphosulfate reductase
VGARIPVVFIGTGLHFAETLAKGDRLATQVSLRILSIASPISVERQAEGFGAELWARDPDLCCALRKVDPIESSLVRCDAWLTGMRASTAVTRFECWPYTRGVRPGEETRAGGWADFDKTECGLHV